ncbi:MAG: glycosyltransferase [bacterium]|nr:glycosyltransferase [bacterium]
MPETLQAIHVVAQIGWTASGVSQSVEGFCRTLAAEDVDVRLEVLAPSHLPGGASYVCRKHAAWPVARRLGISPALSRSLREAAGDAQIMHHHGLWTLPNIYPYPAVRGTGCRLVHSPHGMLSPVALRISPLRKRAAWWLGQAAAVRASDCLHATAEHEVDDIRRQGLRAPVAVIPNGVDLPPPRPGGASTSGPRRLLFLARIHPIKGIDVLLRAWREVERRFPEWELEVIGTERREHLARVRKLAGELGVERVSFPGPAYGEAKTDAFRRSDLYVMPSHAESFGITVAEALAHGVPAITTRGAPWPGLHTHDCGWWIEPGEGALVECLQEALALPRAELERRGERGRRWMERDYAWPRIGRMMRDTYLWLLGGGTPPDWVRE